MSTFGWSYKNNASGSKRPSEQSRKVEEWQKDRDISTPALHPQSHSAESLTAGKKDRRLKCEYVLAARYSHESLSLKWRVEGRCGGNPLKNVLYCAADDVQKVNGCLETSDLETDLQ